MKITSALLTAVLTLPVLAQQQPALQERVDVNLVLLDVTVTDSSGRQILGLGKDDFIVTENGVPQELAAVDYFTNRRLLDGPEKSAAFKVERVREDRYFIIFFDKMASMSGEGEFRQDLYRTRNSLVRFINDELLPQDRVAVAGHDVRLKIYSDFTGDKKQLLAAVDDAMRFSNGLKPAATGAADSILANIDGKKMMNDTGSAFEALELLASAVDQIPARKALLLFTHGLVDNAVLDSPVAQSPRFTPMANALNRANVTAYPMYLARAGTRYGVIEDALSRLAVTTGGEYFRNVVNFYTPLKRIENANNGYYMLSYYPKRSGESDYHSVRVDLRNPEFRVSARTGY